MQPACLVLENGSLFNGQAFGHLSQKACYAVGEVVFNTAMTGYQEILTDPSYAGQLITLTAPQIGNVGVNLEDCESDHIYAKGLIVKQLPYIASNWRAQNGLQAFMAQHKIIGLCGIDTRFLTRILRSEGSLRGSIVAAPEITAEVLAQAKQQIEAFPGLKNQDLAQQVTTKTAYLWQEGGGTWGQEPKKPKQDFYIVAYDFGIKKSILRCMQDHCTRITVVPAKTTASEVLALKPDGVFLSNGPGDPEPCDYAIHAIKTLLEKNIPLFGICLGFQLLALSMGAKTYKMKFGHHGGNHPVKAVESGQVFITSQNHGFAVKEPLPEALMVTHRSLFDQSLQGLAHVFKPAFGFQGHPEAGPGPNEMRVLFENFMDLIKLSKTSHQLPFKDPIPLWQKEPI